MVEIYLLEQLAAFKTYGTLSAAAEALHLTQPTMTRSMKKLEQHLGITLFIRDGKRIRLNDCGKLAAQYAEEILMRESTMEDHLHRMERSQREICFGTVSPGAIMMILPLVTEALPSGAILAEVAEENRLLRDVKEDDYLFAILSRPVINEEFDSISAGSERLYFGFSEKERDQYPDSSVSFAELDGRRILMPAENGIWDQIICENIPNARFLVQEGNEGVNEIAVHSDLPVFNSDIGIRYGVSRPGRICVPIRDPEAKLDFFCVYKRKNRNRMKTLIERIERLP